MPKWTAQRQFPRYPIQLSLLHRVISPLAVGAGVGWTRNLSEGGVCVELAEPLASDTPVRVRLQTVGGAIEAEAKVVWAAEPDANRGVVPHGVAFTQTDANQLPALRNLLHSEEVVRHAGARLPLDLPITCRPKGRPEGRLMQGRTRDICRGGLLLCLPRRLRPGTALEVTVHAPHEDLTAQGEIVWTQPQHRGRQLESIAHGFRFTGLDGAISLSLGFLLKDPL